MTLRLVADAVFTVDADDTVLAPGAVEIDRRADLVGGRSRPGAAGAGTEVRELGGVLMPGPGELPRALADDAGAQRRATGCPSTAGSASRSGPARPGSTDEDVYWGMTLGAAELLSNGVTTTCEQYRHPAPVSRPCSTAGIRGVYTPGIFEVPGTPDRPGQRWDELLAEACRLFDAMDGRAGRLQLGFGPHAAYTVPPEGLRDDRRRGAGGATRCSRSTSRRRRPSAPSCASRYGMSAPALLADVGALDGRVARRARGVARRRRPRAPGARTTWRWRTARGPTASSAPGVAPLPALLERGVRVGLGTDGPASNDDLHLWDEMRLAALLARATAGDPGARRPRRRRCAWPPGAAARRSGCPVGALEVGRPADVIRLRTDDPRFTPALDRRRAARPPRVGRRRLPGHRRLGGRRVRGRGGALHAHRRGARPGRGGPSAPAACSPRKLSPMPGFVDQAQLHAVPATAAPARCRCAARRTSTGAAPTAATAGTAATCGSWRSTNESSLLGFRDHPFRRATDGGHGSGQKRHGARGQGPRRAGAGGHRRARPRRAPSSCDLARHGDRSLVAEGGQGGRGNARFLSNRRRAPAFAEQGEHGEERWLDLELKLMADVALVGFPNAGQVDAHLDGVGGQAQDRRLPLHHARAASRACARRRRRSDGDRVRRGRHPGAGRGRRRRARASGTSSCATSSGPACSSCCSTSARRWSAASPPAEQLACCSPSSARTGPSCSSGRGWSSGSKADLWPRRRRRGRGVCDLVLSAAHRRGCRRARRPARRAGPEARAEAAAGRADRRRRGGRPPARARGGRRAARRRRAWLVVGRAAERAVALSDLTDAGAQAEAVRRLRRLGVDRALARAGARDGDEVTVGTMTFTWGEDQ